jgi:prolyl-tRNA synthetase
MVTIPSECQELVALLEKYRDGVLTLKELNQLEYLLDKTHERIIANINRKKEFLRERL